MKSPTTRTRPLIKFALFLTFLLFHAQSAYAQDKVFSSGGVAIRGYDTVAYLNESRSVPGATNITHEWRGVTWRFSSQANQAAFAKNPDKYAPQYGGYCAYAASKGSLAPTDPNAWTIHNGKLYLNYSPQVRGVWLRDVDSNIAKANANWPRLNR